MNNKLGRRKKMTMPTGNLTFHDNCIPPLETAAYEIYIKSGIEGIDTGDYFDKPITQQFEVYGPQFSLSAAEVHAVYPPGNSNSVYGEVLPHIVLNNKVLPWERRFSDADETIPWLCLLVFREGEIPVDPKTHSTLIKSTVQDFLTDSPDILKPEIDPEQVAADVLQSQCRSILISAAAFKGLTPFLDELKYLVHVRQGDTGNQVMTGTGEPGWFSVVVGNRFLTAAEKGSRYYVYLVSLEGFSDYLKAGAELPKKKSDPSRGKDVQMISFYNWTFVSQSRSGESFTDLVENFVKQSCGIPEKLLLRRYVESATKPEKATKLVLERLNNGYVPVTYQAPTGEETFAWYRGPCIPVTAQPLPRSPEDYSYPSAAAAMIYDKETGVFDQSYAAAWSLGRALALADGSFSQAVGRLQKRAFRLVGKWVDNLKGNDAPSTADLEEAARRSAVRNSFAELLADGVGMSLTRMFQNITGAAPRTRKEPAGYTIDPVAAFRQLLVSQNVRDFLKRELREEILPVARWLAKKQLLYDIPLIHLVPDQQMLPVESLRLFYIDRNWLDVVTDGALSIGIKSTKNEMLIRLMKKVIASAIRSEIGRLRESLPGLSAEEADAEPEETALSGLLIRSAVVSGWPGLVIEAERENRPVKILRMDRLSANVLICLFLDIPDTVKLSEPLQGLRFGVEEDDDVINLRQLSEPVGKLLEGKIFPAAGGFKQFFRKPVDHIGGSVLNINDGPGSLVQTMQQSQYLGQSLGPADLAVEMVKVPEQISFKPPSTLKKKG